VTYLSPDLAKNVPPTLHNIYFDKLYEACYGDSGDALDLIEMAKETSVEALRSFYTFGEFSCKGVESSETGIKTLLSYPDNFKFDLVLYDFTIGPALLGIIKKFNYPPVI
jgi:glucuronosyltransferase